MKRNWKWVYSLGTKFRFPIFFNHFHVTPIQDKRRLQLKKLQWWHLQLHTLEKMPASCIFDTHTLLNHHPIHAKNPPTLLFQYQNPSLLIPSNYNNHFASSRVFFTIRSVFSMFLLLPYKSKSKFCFFKLRCSAIFLIQDPI